MARTIDDLIDERVNQRIDQEIKLKSLPSLPEPPSPTLASQAQKLFIPQLPKSPTDLLPSLVPGSSIIASPLKAGGKVIAGNPAGAAKILPGALAGIAGFGGNVVGGPAVGIPAAGAAGAAGKYLENKVLQATNSPEAVYGNKDVGKSVAWEGGKMALAETLPIAAVAAKPYIKELGLGAIDHIGSLPQGTAKTAYENTKILGKGVAENYTRHVANLARGLSKMLKDAGDKIQGEYTTATAAANATKNGQRISVPKIMDILDESIATAKSRDASEATVGALQKIRDKTEADLSQTYSKDTFDEKSVFGGDIRVRKEFTEPRGNTDVETAIKIKKRTGRVADFAEGGPGSGVDANAGKDAYAKLADAIHEKFPEIKKVDKDYKTLIEGSQYLRDKLGIKEGEEATKASVEKIETFIRTINNPAKKETVHEFVDAVAKEMGAKRSVVKKAQEINAAREMGSVFPKRRSVNLQGKVGRAIDASLSPVLGPKAMGAYIKATKFFSGVAGKIPNKKEIAQAGLRGLFGKLRKK